MIEKKRWYHAAFFLSFFLYPAAAAAGNAPAACPSSGLLSVLSVLAPTLLHLGLGLGLGQAPFLQNPHSLTPRCLPS